MSSYYLLLSFLISGLFLSIVVATEIPQDGCIKNQDCNCDNFFLLSQKPNNYDSESEGKQAMVSEPSGISMGCQSWCGMDTGPEMNSECIDDTQTGGPQSGLGYPDIHGDWDSWYRPGLYDRGYFVIQNGKDVKISESDGTSFCGYFIDSDTVSVEAWTEDGNISGNGKRIDWNKNGYWVRT